MDKQTIHKDLQNIMQDVSAIQRILWTFEDVSEITDKEVLTELHEHFSCITRTSSAGANNIQLDTDIGECMIEINTW